MINIGGILREYVLGAIVFLLLGIFGCGGGNQSSVEGKLVDWDGKPVSGVKIAAFQMQPIKGYEKLVAITSADGNFHLKGLYPSSRYQIIPLSDKWETETSEIIESAPKGETAMLSSPIAIRFAYAKNGSPILNLSTGETRFMVSAEGIITDSFTGLEWIMGPDENTSNTSAKEWLDSCTVGGGKWRLPTRSELKGLYQQGASSRNMDKAFTTTGWFVWAAPENSSSAWGFSFDSGRFEASYDRRNESDRRVFGVRSTKK